MKKLIAAVLALCMLLSGCGVIHENNKEGRQIPAATLIAINDNSTGSAEKLAVYFYNNTSKTLTAEVRTAVIDQDTNPAEIAVKELLKGPSDSKLLSAVAPEGMTLDYIEFSRSVANVYLKYNGPEMESEPKYILEQAIANTVTDALGAAYISVLYNGTSSAFYAGIPYGPLEKQTGNIEDAWSQVSAKFMDTHGVPGEETMIIGQPTGTTVPTAAAKPTAPPTSTKVSGLTSAPTPAPTKVSGPMSAPTSTEQAPKVKTISSILYYISSDGSYLLPEVHKVNYTDGDYIKSLIAELVKGPQNTSVMASPVADGLELSEDPVFTQNGGNYVLTLDFNKQPSKDIAGAQGTLLTYASIVYTITGFIPNLTGVEIYADGIKVNAAGSEYQPVLKRADYKSFIGSSAPVYFADKASDLLLQVSRSMEQGEVWSARERVLELIKGPLPGDGEDASKVVPAGITDKDILSVKIYSDTAYVDLSKNFADSCSGISAKSEMLLVYATVNTITAMDGINKVQFLVEGQQADTLSGSICLTDPFLKNYGIVKGSS